MGHKHSKTPTTTTTTSNMQPTPSQSQHQDPIIATAQNPQPAQHYYYVVEAKDDEFLEAHEASASLSMSICLSLLFSLFGCFLMSCFPFWFTYLNYRDSPSQRAKRIARISQGTCWILTVMNILFIAAGLIVAIIVPPVVAYA
ncbi:hypothetical protein C9374_010087 [Naegleria lovaniensis]|uniref:Transmembrane protein n=1 Tax=Naegleria lovaniensis TaxID=51637 RepID=A0AA88GH48_NAELO|nr:uncharacterized protein C9374_010087 [Naegleria lovaniensis]KAG2375083.1 hypothetical protein C9374_010087 [Naegleria lovaniensis]